MKKLIQKIVFLALMVTFGVKGYAQTDSQVSGTFSVACNLSLVNPSSFGTVTFPLQTNFVSSQISYGANGVGAMHANQLFVGQFLVTNGAAFGLNMINLNTFTNNGVASPLDSVGNAFSLRNIKWIGFQNLGQAGYPNESNFLKVTVPTTGVTAGAGWTNYITGDANIGCLIPGPSASPAPTNTPLTMFWAPGDIGWPVGTGASDNLILLTNPIAWTTNVLTVNVYVMGSTNQ